VLEQMWNQMRFAAVLLLVGQAVAFAHCDGLDGPVVRAARAALEARDVRLVLPWVRPGDEAAVREAFDKVQPLRGLNAAAREVADRYFFETVVRIHRAGEGAPYTGLKPAGADPGPAIVAAERAIADGGLGALQEKLLADAKAGLGARLERVREAKDYAPADVAAGRRYVAAYVDFLHYAEALARAAGPAAEAREHHEHN
jgi:hypothetical protein